MGIGWDDPLPINFTNEWIKLGEEYAEISKYKIPRSIIAERDSCILHIFCDASTKDYGAAAYVVADGKASLLTSKPRVTPVKSRTIPQLELTALLIGTRLGVYIRQTLPYNYKYRENIRMV